MGRRRKRKKMNLDNKQSQHNTDIIYTPGPQVYTRNTEISPSIFFSTNDTSTHTIFTVACIIAGMGQSPFINVNNNDIHSIPCKELAKYLHPITATRSTHVVVTTSNTSSDTFFGALRTNNVIIANNDKRVILYPLLDTHLYIARYDDIYWASNNYIAICKIAAMHDISKEGIISHRLNRNDRVTITDAAGVFTSTIDPNLRLSTALEKSLEDYICVLDVDGKSKKIEKLSPITKQLITDTAKPNKKVVEGINLIWKGLIEEDNENAIVGFIETLEERPYFLHLLVGTQC